MAPAVQRSAVRQSGRAYVARADMLPSRDHLSLAYPVPPKHQGCQSRPVERRYRICRRIYDRLAIVIEGGVEHSR